MRGWVVRGFGLNTIDIGCVAAQDLSGNNAADGAASRHGLALALPTAYVHALEAVLGNSHLRTRLATVGHTVARELFDNTVRVAPLATINDVDADDSPTDSGEALHTIEPGVLSTLYPSVTLAAANPGTEAVPLTPTGPPRCCINHNLPGAKLSNGLGMLKRFTFTAAFTCSIGIKLADDKGAPLDGKDTSASARSDRGGKVRTNEWGDAVQIPVEAGARYTVLFQQTRPEVFQGNRCSNSLSLWRMPA